MKYRPLSLNELMGENANQVKTEGMSMEHLSNMLGEKMPDIKPGPVGKIRLLRALRMRFGQSYRSIPGVPELLKDFDEQTNFHVKLAQMKMLKPKRSK